MHYFAIWLERVMLVAISLLGFGVSPAETTERVSVAGHSEEETADYGRKVRKTRTLQILQTKLNEGIHAVQQKEIGWGMHSKSTAHLSRCERFQVCAAAQQIVWVMRLGAVLCQMQ
ncbi:hypothetical protein C8J57DRAFT_1245743 [Mycena rebaudengoi]|nr:hypothetical protein C8J57DRAFT_1245743 [Mycena rebaudengoi]